MSLALHRNNFEFKERRKQVATLLSRSFNETEIAQQLGVDQSTISRDIRALKVASAQFVYDLAKSDLAYYYKKSLDGIEEAKRESWKIYNDETVVVRDKLLALKLVITSEESRFRLLSEGPALLAVKSLEDRLNRIEGMGERQQQVDR